ncbi:aspartate beta-hydroxylase domain-containing protein 1-like [Amphibalanus amphitrite]|uniref:aspartate beta-hydroxylase domain-containing protein 1-like n=1 Tax=Amphibalanus amphitrite TaxID=1232801 RepID=UPI001C92998C|nr:aspartate beta-hydroxylase domain-containing protein 1-like [Amphibalanus amphitrite]XP_043239894.1 aspartate beta-hydroxylase domain-containing protein 1-like [Amphibalanus amphitrite]
MDSYLQSCCGDHLQWRLPDSLEAGWAALGVTLAAGLVCVLLLRRLRPAPAPPPPDQCRSLDCTRCHGAADAADRAAARLEQAAAAGQLVSDRVRRAVAEWRRTGGAGEPAGRLMVAELSERVWWYTAHEADQRRLQLAAAGIASDYRWARDQPHRWSVNSSPAGRWRLFWLVNQGRSRLGPGECAATLASVDSLAGAMRHTVFSNVCFSVLEPGTSIEPHLGPTNVRVRCHLGLEVPDGCRLVVAGEERPWTRDQCLLFDDSHLHHAGHGGQAGEPRVVLMVDMWHPLLTADERRLLEEVLRPPDAHTSQ